MHFRKTTFSIILPSFDLRLWKVISDSPWHVILFYFLNPYTLFVTRILNTLKSIFSYSSCKRKKSVGFRGNESVRDIPNKYRLKLKKKKNLFLWTRYNKQRQNSRRCRYGNICILQGRVWMTWSKFILSNDSLRKKLDCYFSSLST